MQGFGPAYSFYMSLIIPRKKQIEICGKLHPALSDLMEAEKITMADLRKNKGNFPVGYRTMLYLKDNVLPLRLTKVIELLELLEIDHELVQPKIIFK